LLHVRRTTVRRVPRSENADIRGRRARRQGAPDDATELSRIQTTTKGGIQMAKKAAKGSKKKAAKKR